MKNAEIELRSKDQLFIEQGTLEELKVLPNKMKIQGTNEDGLKVLIWTWQKLKGKSLEK